MTEGLNIQKQQDHLNLNIEGAKPIIACVGSLDDFEKSGVSLEHINNKFGLTNPENINWASNTIILDGKQFLHADERTYVISAIDNSNKFSKNFVPCTGLVIAGIDKETGENISFMSHQIPTAILAYRENENKLIDLKYRRKEFTAHLEQQLVEIKEKCRPGSIDAVIIGGTYDYDRFEKQRYLNSVELLGAEVKKVLDFEPLVINGPKKTRSLEGDDIYYDNENRRLYFVRPKVNPNIGSFVPSEVDKYKDKF